MPENTSKHYTVVPNLSNPVESAVIFLDNEQIDEATAKQVQHMVSSYTSLKHTRVMPDCHVGQCCCIGFTSEFCVSAVVPSFVGGDIGCGILTYPINKAKLNLKQLEKYVKNIIPMGSGHTNIHVVPPIEESFVARYLERASAIANEFAQRHCVSSPAINYSYFVGLLQRIGMDENVCLRSFGTLGGGNHFIEVNQHPDTKQYYLTIHSGSRAFGMKLFEYYNAMTLKRTTVSDGESASLSTAAPSSSAASSAGQGKCLSPSDSLAYCFDMIVAQQLAVMNRHIMLQLILRYMAVDYDESQLIESTHNYLDFSRNILRKGAISAEADQLCLVALNMKDGILVCRGKGMLEESVKFSLVMKDL